MRTNPSQEDWQGADLWNEGDSTRNILIPLETDKSNIISGFVVLDDKGFPEGGQRTLFDYAGNSYRERCASLIIHRELEDPVLQDGYTITLLKLAHSIDHCNEYSRNHAVKTAFWAKTIAAELGFNAEQLKQITLASQLHDVGKVVVPKSILTKPGQLSADEWLIMRRHPSFGAMIMRPSARLHPLIPIVKSHHENFDGSGYPLGLKSEQIPLPSRIISVADTYATITEGRVYRQPCSKAEALRELLRYSCRQFDPEIVSLMVDLTITGEIDDTHCTWEAR
jgi:HD-GYP domain-containing protein (c-di-GMP phosphodiesterase class II)